MTSKVFTTGTVIDSEWLNDVNNATYLGLSQPLPVPATATATGVVGTSTWDDSYLYICIATNTWKRVAISTW
jgi:hypothetical protein